VLDGESKGNQFIEYDSECEKGEWRNKEKSFLKSWACENFRRNNERAEYKWKHNTQGVKAPLNDILFG
jgi:hypothetical protein